MNLTSTKAVEEVRAVLLRELPRHNSVTINDQTYYTVGHKTPVGTRYNLQIGNRFYRDLTLSGLATVIAYAQ